MPYIENPESGIVFVLAIFVMAILATLFPEKEDK